MLGAVFILITLTYRLAFGIGQDFIVDHLFCKTDGSSTNNGLIENIFILNLNSSLPGTNSKLRIDKRYMQITFFLFLYENICCGYSLEAHPTRHL